jgi:hypothetical protein
MAINTMRFITSSGTVDVLPAASVAAQINAKVAELVNSAPETLDTLKEIADALGNDPNLATTLTTALGNKLDASGGTVSGDLSVTGTLTPSSLTIPSTAGNGNIWIE